MELQDLKNMLRIDGNYDDTNLMIHLEAAKLYVLNSINIKSGEHHNSIILDPRFKMVVGLLAASWYEAKSLTSETQQHTLPHAFYSLIQQLDFIYQNNEEGGDGEEQPTDPVEPQPTTFDITINGTVYQALSKTPNSFVLKGAQTFTGNFINVNGIDYRLLSSNGSESQYEALTAYQIVDIDWTSTSSFRGFIDSGKLYLVDMSLVPKNAGLDLDGVRYTLTAVDDHFTYEVYEESPVYNYNTYFTSYDVETGAFVNSTYIDGSYYPKVIAEDDFDLGEDQYYKMSGEEDFFIYNSDKQELEVYVPKAFDFNTNYHIVDSTTIEKKGLAQTAHKFRFEGFDYELSNPRSYIDRTIFNYTKTEVVIPDLPTLKTQPYTQYALRNETLVNVGEGNYHANEDGTILMDYTSGAVLRHTGTFYKTKDLYVKLSDGKMYKTAQVPGSARWSITEHVGTQPVDEKLTQPPHNIDISNGSSLLTGLSNYYWNNSNGRFIIPEETVVVGVPYYLKYGSTTVRYLLFNDKVKKDRNDLIHVSATSAVDYNMPLFDEDMNPIGIGFQATGFKNKTLTPTMKVVNGTGYSLPFNAKYIKFGQHKELYKITDWNTKINEITAVLV